MKNDSLTSMLRNKRILVTGGTGSFGQTIVRSLIKFKPAEIRILSRSEDKQDQMKYFFEKEPILSFILGDVRDYSQVNRAVSGCDYVFHAAAQKQVPASEINVLEAVKTNVLGAQNVIDAAKINKVHKVIAISTDKAVEPVNAMGMSKALQEKLFIAANTHLNGNKTVFACVRYGNVLGSTGSVLPLFLKQIKYEKNLTITNPEMTRFIITLNEAIDLVFIATYKAQGGEIFVPDIPTHKVIDLAQTVLSMFPQTKSQIVISGIRIGEKLHETLITPTESIRTIHKKGYYIIYPPLIKTKTIFHKNAPLFRFSSDTAKEISKERLGLLVKNYVSSTL